MLSIYKTYIREWIKCEIMNENRIIFRLDLIIVLLISNLLLMLIWILPPELVGPVLPVFLAFLLPLGGLMILLRIRQVRKSSSG